MEKFETGQNLGENRTGKRFSQAVLATLLMGVTGQAADVGTGSNTTLVRSSMIGMTHVTNIAPARSEMIDLTTLQTNQKVNQVLLIPSTMPPKEGFQRWLHEWKNSRKIMFGTLPGTNVRIGGNWFFSNQNGKIQ